MALLNDSGQRKKLRSYRRLQVTCRAVAMRLLIARDYRMTICRVPWLRRLFQNVNSTPRKKVFRRSPVESCLDEKRSWNETLRCYFQRTNE